MAFIVVHFLDTDEVSIISHSWLHNENICKWPPYENRLSVKRALLEKRIPEDDWNDREIFIMSVHDTYAKAKKEVDIALQTESDDEIKTPETKRQKLKALLEKSSPPSVPDIRKKEIGLDPYSPTKVIFFPYESILSTPVQPKHVSKKILTSNISSASHVNSNFIRNILSDSIINQPSLHSSSVETLSPVPLDSISSYDNSSAKNKMHCTSERRTSVLSPISLNSISPNQDSPPRNKMCCSSEEKLITLEKTLKSMEFKLSSISNAVEELKEKPFLNASVCKENCDINLIELPLSTFSQIKTIEEMSAFNDSLADKKIFSEMVKSFGFMGGRDISEATRKILAKLVSNDLARKMNWVGNARKKSFQEFQSVIQLIIAAIHQNKSFKEATLFEVKDPIARWLRYSNDRDGGRSKRKKKSEADIKTDKVQARRSLNNKQSKEDTNAPSQ